MSVFCVTILEFWPQKDLLKLLKPQISKGQSIIKSKQKAISLIAVYILTSTNIKSFIAAHA